jgi:transposase
LAVGEVLGVLHSANPRAYLLKQQLRQIYRLPTEQAIELLDAWIGWARRCRLAPFVKLARTITAQRRGIVAAMCPPLPR